MTLVTITIDGGHNYLRSIHQLPKRVHFRVSNKVFELNCHHNKMYKNDS